MSAFRRRTVFAAPIILTVAACSGGKTPEDPQPKRYPGPTWHVSQRGPDTCMASETDQGCPKGVMCNPPPPQDIKCPAFPEGREWARVVKRPSGDCALLPDGCFDDTCVGAKTDCPLPFGEQLPPPTETGSAEPAKPAP